MTATVWKMLMRPEMVAHVFNTRRGRQTSEFDTSLLYRWSSRTARDTKRNAISGCDPEVEVGGSRPVSVFSNLLIIQVTICCLPKMSSREREDATETGRKYLLNVIKCTQLTSHSGLQSECEKSHLNTRSQLAVLFGEYGSLGNVASHWCK